MVGAGDLLVAGLGRALPRLHDDLALAPELARFQRADDRVQGAAGPQRPESRRDLAHVFGGQPQILVRAHAKERREIVQAGDRVAGGCQIGRRLGIERRPVGADHGGGKMPAGGMADDEHGPIKPLPQEQAGAAHLLDDVGDRDDRAQIVTRDGDRDAARVQAARHVAEHGRIERAPIAAMNEQRQRRGIAGLPRGTDRGIAAACRRTPGRARRGPL